MSHLLMFYGKECVHCKLMFPLVDKLKEEHNLDVEKLEMWHHAENQKRFNEVNTIHCSAVPFFYNEKSKEGICGNTDYETLVAWATKE